MVGNVTERNRGRGSQEGGKSPGAASLLGNVQLGMTPLSPLFFFNF